MKQVLVQVISNAEVIPGVCLIWLESPEIASGVRPGQFVMVRCGDGILRRPLSVHQVDGTKTRLALLFAVVGEGTKWLTQRKPGEPVDLFGPMGNGFTIVPGAKSLLMVAGGLGIAPLCFWAESAGKGHNVKLLLGAGSAARLCSDLVPSNVELVTVTEDGSHGKSGLVTDLLPDLAGRHDQMFACGPMPMYRAMAQMPELEGRNVQISLEMRMACGFGVCYGCTVKTRQGLKEVCRDGPVFHLDDILWDQLRC